jgi:hypothetical protein
MDAVRRRAIAELHDPDDPFKRRDITVIPVEAGGEQ